MHSTKNIIKKSWGAILLLAVVVFAVRWVVMTQRGPGSTTVIEAQGMDMSVMKAPMGVFPVETDSAQTRELEWSETFPATVLAYSDEEVVARVPGLVKTISVYPGDRVVAGQLLATLQADELGNAATSASLSASALASNARGAEQALVQQRSVVKKAEFEHKAALAQEAAAQAEVMAMEASLSSAEQMVIEANAKVKEAEAAVDYAKINVERQRKLYEKGAIARNKVDEAEREIGESVARKEQAVAQSKIAQTNVTAMKSKLNAAKNMSTQATAFVEVSRASVGEAKANLARTEEDSKATKQQAASAKASALSASAVSSYTELRASDSGIVSERLVSPGSSIMAGATVLRIKVDRMLRVQADLPQRLAQSTTIGTKVQIKIDSRMIEGSITSVFPSIESSTRSFRVEAMIENRDGKILSGSFAQIEISTSRSLMSLSVARDAVKFAADNSNFVWVVKEKPGEPTKDAIYTCTMHPEIRQKGPGVCPICKMDLVPMDASGNFSVEKRKVEIGGGNSRFIAVLKGLEEGEIVTVHGDASLFPGAAVSTSQDEKSTMKSEELHSGH